LGCIPLLSLHQVLGRLSDISVLFNEFLEYLCNGTQNSAISKKHWLRDGIDIIDTQLLDSNVSGTYKEMTMKKMIISKGKK